MSALVELAERGWLPDWLVRIGVRRLLQGRLAFEREPDVERQQERYRRFLDALRGQPIAVETARANEQHYEVPAEFFELVLGRWRKYSCCYWPAGVADLDGAEEAMLELTCRRAGVADGMRVLDLGCGWGSLSLWIASRFPRCRVLAVSNSNAQREAIERRAAEMSLGNVTVQTANAAHFDTDLRFDRVVSIEMFEHMRNPEALLARVAEWLAPEGRAFVHVFCHREHAYLFEDEASSWMGSTFFTGGMMPAERMLLGYQRDLALIDHWRVAGTHYSRTLRAWLARLDARRGAAAKILRRAGAGDEAARQLQRWRLFFIGCEESFAFRGGAEWYVSHYLYGKR